MEGTEVTCGCYKTKKNSVVFPITEVVTENEFFDYDAFGHAGFTGTHVVMNKTNKTAVVFLTNKQNVGFKPDSTSYYSPYSCCGEICELVWNIFGTEAPAETLADKIGAWL